MLAAHPQSHGTERRAQVRMEQILEHILERYHAPLPAELDRLVDLAARVVERHVNAEPRRLPAVYDALVHLRSELLDHLAREEQILFPWILSGDPLPAVGPVQGMLADHERVNAALARLRTHTGNYAVPSFACRLWRDLWRGIETLERDLHLHHALEDEILVPRITTERA